MQITITRAWSLHPAWWFSPILCQIPWRWCSYLQITFARLLVLNDRLCLAVKKSDLWPSNQAHVGGQGNYQHSLDYAINNEYYFTILSQKFSIQVFDSFLEDIWVHLIFSCALYMHGKDFTFLKHLGFLLFPMTRNSSFSPVALAVLIPVSLTFLCLLPVHFSPFRSGVLFGSAWKEKPNSSALKMSRKLHLDSIVGKWVCSQYAVISGVDDFVSPDIVLNVTLFRAFHLSTHPFDALKSAIPNILAKSVAFSWSTNPLTGKLFDLNDIYYLKIALSKDSYFPAFIFFLFKLIFPDENTVIIFSLLAGKGYVEIVLLGTPYFWATNNLSWPLSISSNTFNLSSMEVFF